MPFAYGLELLQPAFPDRPTPYIAYGSRFHNLAADHVANTLSATRVYVIASAGLVRSTPVALERLKSSLGDKLVGIRIGMSPHTRWDEVIEVANDAAKYRPDCIITLGAGSLTDASKVIAWMLSNNVTTSSTLDEMWFGSPNQRHDFEPSTIRTIAIPTSLSGGEYQARAGVTRSDGSNRKCPFYPPPRNPSLVILDPELVTTTPERIWLSSGIRAVDHCVETLCSLKSTEAGDAAAERGLLKLVPSLLQTKADPTNLDARFASMMGVIDSMAAVTSGATLGASHAIGHHLGPLGVGHGETSCIALPAVCKWNAAHAISGAGDGDSSSTGIISRQNKCRDLLLGDPVVADLVRKSHSPVNQVDLGDVLDLVIRALGMPRSLTEVGVGRDKLDGLAANTLLDTWAPTNPVPLKAKEQVLEILEMVV